MTYPKSLYDKQYCELMFDVKKVVEKLLKEFKGIEKQMKYLWQTLDELKEKK